MFLGPARSQDFDKKTCSIIARKGYVLFQATCYIFQNKIVENLMVKIN